MVNGTRNRTHKKVETMANDAVKVFIGTSSNGEDAKIEMAYEHSIRKNCSRPVDITWMRQTNDETSFGMVGLIRTGVRIFWFSLGYT